MQTQLSQRGEANERHCWETVSVATVPRVTWVSWDVVDIIRFLFLVFQITRPRSIVAKTAWHWHKTKDIDHRAEWSP